MIKIFGASDDLIEVEGDIEEEFSPAHGKKEYSYLGFSDGTILRVMYTEPGVWRITPEVRGSAVLEIQQCSMDDEENYSDVATLSHGTWVMFGAYYATARRVP